MALFFTKNTHDSHFNNDKKTSPFTKLYLKNEFNKK